MPNLNQVNLMGNLTRDPELRYTANNSAVCSFGLAINRKFTINGEQREETTFVDVTAWGRVGEVVNEYCRKGDPLFVTGRLTLDQWEDKSGNKRSKLKVTAEQVQLLGGGNRQQSKPQRQQEPLEHQPVGESDIPF